MPSYNCLFHNPQSVDSYQNCRFITDNVLKEVIEQMYSVYSNLNANNSIIDAGVGNGRLFIPLLKHSDFNKDTHFFGLDISDLMIQDLLKNLKKTDLGEKNISILLWDLQYEYPEICKNTSLIYTLATFHILQNWKKALQNVYSSLCKNGVFIYIKEINQFMHQSEGFSFDNEILKMDKELREFMLYYHSLRTELGCPFVPSGIMYSDISNMRIELNNLGFKEIAVIKNSKLEWQKPHNYNDILYSFKNRLITTWGSDLSDDIRIIIYEKLKVYINKKRLPLKETFYLPAYLELHCFQK